MKSIIYFNKIDFLYFKYNVNKIINNVFKFNMNKLNIYYHFSKNIIIFYFKQIALYLSNNAK